MGCRHHSGHSPVWLAYSGILRRSRFTMHKMVGYTCAVLGWFAFALPILPAQEPAAQPADDYVRSHYTKYEYRIPMRDGKRLFTAVYVPKDAAAGPYPFLMQRTPY